MGFNYCEVDVFDKVMACELSDNSLAVVSTEDKMGHVEVTQVWADKDQNITNGVLPKAPQQEKKMFERSDLAFPLMVSPGA